MHSGFCPSLILRGAGVSSSESHLYCLYFFFFKSASVQVEHMDVFYHHSICRTSNYVYKGYGNSNQNIMLYVKAPFSSSPVDSCN